jgi:uncharacterized membrane protein YdbT with pleckstrin-like domain
MASAAIENLRERSLDAIEFRSSTKAFLFQSGTGWLLILVTLASMGMAAIFTVPFVVSKWLGNRTSRFWLEGDRLFMRRGILMRSEEEIELYRIKDIKASFSVIQQLFGNGDIQLLTSDATGRGAATWKSFAVADVRQARDIREELRSRVEAARIRKGVREYDVA